MRLKAIALAALSVVAVATDPPSAHASATPQLDRAVQTVQRDSAHYPGSRTNRIAWATFRYVNRTIDELKATRDAIDRHIPLPTTVEDALRRKAGACGNTVEIALAIADRLHVPARPVQAWYTMHNGQRGGHIMVEYHIDGGWRLFDILSNTVYRSPVTHKLLSLTQLRAMPLESALLRADRGPDTGFEKDGASVYYRYLIDRDAQTTIDGRGTVTWPTHAAQANVPSYIGHAGPGSNPNLRARFTGLTAGQVTVHLAGGCNTGTIVAQSRVRSVAAADSATVTLPVSGPNVVLSIEGAGCYALIQRVDG